MKPIVLSVEADREFTQAKKWYEQIEPALAGRFYESVLAALQLIADAPAAWPPYDEVYRHFPLKKFPYTIFYAELETVIVVDAIAHQSRKPNYWQN